jgi:hypothetical protein
MIPLVRRTPAGRRARTLFLAALLVGGDVGLAHAQDTTTARRDGWIVGPLLGLPGLGSEYDPTFFTLGVGVTRLAPNRPGLDLAIGTIPRLIPEGVIPIGLRIGPSIPLSLSPDVFIIPSAGLSGVGAAGTAGAGAIGGFYWGAAAVVAQGPIGFRVGFTSHRVPDTDVSVWLVEIGVMHVPMPRHKH